MNEQTTVPLKSIGMNEKKWNILKSLADVSESEAYWSKAYDFIMSIRNRELSTLSLRQRNWLTEIIAELEDKEWKK